MICPYLQTFSNTIQLLLDGSISPTIATTFCSTFLALHKSATNPLKLHPVPSNASSAQYLQHLTTGDFASHLLPSRQLGISIHGSIETIVHLSHTMLESYITCPLYANTSATHVMLLLDIINMFNSISRESVHHKLR
jgi:hypothetical protein